MEFTYKETPGHLGTGFMATSVDGKRVIRLVPALHGENVGKKETPDVWQIDYWIIDTDFSKREEFISRDSAIEFAKELEEKEWK